MPRGTRKYELSSVSSLLKSLFHIPQNKVCCGEALNVTHAASSEIILDRPCRRIRVTAAGLLASSWSVWFSWKTDRTNQAGGRVIVTREAPLEILLDKPEDHFYVLRNGNAGQVDVAIMGVY